LNFRRSGRNRRASGLRRGEYDWPTVVEGHGAPNPLDFAVFCKFDQREKATAVQMRHARTPNHKRTN
jgi:hypothetical protein